MPHSESVLPLGVPIAPTEPTDPNPTHIAEYGRGGLMSVADLTARGNISSDRKTAGMLVYVQSEAKYYTLTTLPNTWTELSTGGGAVTSVTGTANEVTVSPTTGAVVVGLPDDVTVRDLNAEHVKFDTTPTVTTAAQADMVWTDNQSTVSVGMSSTVSAALGQTVYKRGKNVSGAPIAKGKVVYITGGTGSADLTFGLATNATEAGSSAAIGFAAETIADNAHGFVICTGILTGIDTSAFPMNEGQAMYLGTAGDVIASLPTQPAHGVFCGWLVKKGAGSSGVLYAKFDNYQELEELSDVLIGTAGGGIALADGNILQYDGASGVWRNKSLDGDKGDVTVSGGGATWTIDNGAVTLAKLQNVTTERLLGRDSPGTGAVELIAVTGGIEFSDFGSIQTGPFTGDVTKASAGTVLTIANDAVTYAKMQNVSATDRLLGRQSAGAGDVEEITCTAAGRALIDDANAGAQRTTLGLIAGGDGDIWVEKAGDAASASTSIKANFGTGWSWGYTATPDSTSSAQLTCFDFANYNNAASNVATGNFYASSSVGMYVGANANGNVGNVRGAQTYGAVLQSNSVAATGTITSVQGLFVTGCTRFGGTSTGTITNLFGADIVAAGFIANSASPAFTVATAIGLRVQDCTSSNTITTQVGVDVSAQTRGSGTNVGVRIAAPSGGTTTVALQLSGTTGAASGILFGSGASADTNLYRRGANVLATDDTFEALNVSGTNTGDQLTYSKFTPVDNAPPAANAATSGLRNRIPVLEFDDATDETAYFIDVMPQGAKLTSGLKVRIHWTAATATTGNCYWAVAFERLNTDIDVDSFGADTLLAATTNGTSGVPNVTEITVTTIDGITAGDAYRLRIVRQGSNVLDTMAGDAQIIAVEIRSAV